ncbi:MAG: hypothetical protein LIR46_02860 [Bacteroidota bacterium]|nr:hypothetical protein [Bacteroidota bacterium]
MGEELETGKLYLKTPDGQMVEWNGLENAQLITGSEVDHEENKIYGIINRNDSMEFECEAKITRQSWLTIMFGGNRRMIRRALRWYERLRRMELKHNVKLSNRFDHAAQCACFKANNKKPKTPHVYTYWFMMHIERKEKENDGN